MFSGEMKSVLVLLLKVDLVVSKLERPICSALAVLPIASSTERNKINTVLPLALKQCGSEVRTLGRVMS